MCVCKKCKMIGGAIFVVLGVLFLMKDMGKWDFWGIQWWSAVLIAVGLCHIASSMCKDCQEMCSPKK